MTTVNGHVNKKSEFYDRHTTVTGVLITLLIAIGFAIQCIGLMLYQSLGAFVIGLMFVIVGILIFLLFFAANWK